MIIFIMVSMIGVMVIGLGTAKLSKFEQKRRQPSFSFAR